MAQAEDDCLDALGCLLGAGGTVFFLVVLGLLALRSLGLDI